MLEKTGEMVKPRTFTEVEARIHWRGQSWRPAQEPRPMMVVLRFLLRRAPEAASKSLQARSPLQCPGGHLRGAGRRPCTLKRPL